MSAKKKKQANDAIVKKHVNKLTPSELFTLIQEEPKKANRIKLLELNTYKEINTILALNFDPNIKLALPVGVPPYTPCPIEHSPNSIKTVFAPIGKLVEEYPLDNIKKEGLFMGMLEQMTQEDGDILIAAKDGKLTTFSNRKYSKITLALVKQAIPQLLQ